MGHKTLISGTAYEVTGGRTLIGGTAYGISGGRTLVGGSGDGISFGPWKRAFADNSWADIIAACQSKTVPDTWFVGDQKEMTIGGAGYLIDIIGKNHDTYADDGGKAPLTFQLHEASFQGKVMGQSGDTANWENCYMRNTELPKILGTMPAEVQSSIRAVVKLNIAANKTSLESTSDTLFLLSMREVTGESYLDLSDGEQYEYYQSEGRAIKYDSGVAVDWFTRTPAFPNDGWNNAYNAITSGGSCQYVSGNLTTIGTSFAFCF